MGTVGGGIDPALGEALSGITGADNGFSFAVVLSAVIKVASTSGTATLGTASSVTGIAGKTNALSASTS